jgi:hypothetical protein
MKKMIMTLVIGFGMVAVGCNKKDLNPQSMTNVKNVSMEISQTKQQIGVSKAINPYDERGKLHNAYLDELLTPLKGLNKDQTIAELKLNISQDDDLKNSQISADWNVYSNPFDLMNYLDNDIVPIITVSDIAKTEAMNMISFIDKNKPSLPQLQKVIDANVLRVMTTFNDSDKESILTFYAILDHTSEYWAPISQGGLGGFDTFIGDHPNTAAMASINWYKVGYTDCLSGMFLGHLSAAVGSACSIIGQW